tara:strand:- start:171 stop:542 length:372 start_codon:yes stop_codon:yes gene_type:complete
MKTLFKVFIGAILFFIALGVLGNFVGLDSEGGNLSEIKLAVEMDLEAAAKARLNFAKTYDKGVFVMTETESYTKGDEVLTEADATLSYTGENAFGKTSTFIMTAEVQYNLETTAYKVINIKTK